MRDGAARRHVTEKIDWELDVLKDEVKELEAKAAQGELPVITSEVGQ